MGTPKQMVDAYLGDGTYDEWKKMDIQGSDAESKFFLRRSQLQLPLSSPLVERISEDFEVVDKIADDYSAALKLASVGRRPSKERVRQVHDLYQLALIVGDNQNDMLDAMFATGFAGAMIVFPVVLLEAQANQMLDALEELQQELEKAEQEVSNAKCKGAFHLVATCIETMIPEVSLLAHAGFFLSDLIVDKALGPSDPTTIQKVKGSAPPSIKLMSEAVHHIPEFGHKAHAVAEKMGKAATAATFYFDYEEISESGDRAEKLRELTESVKRGHDGLVKVLEANKVRIHQFLLAFQRWMNVIEGIRTETDGYRERLSDDMDEFGYSIRKATTWPDAA
jgi:nucleotide-binding universal stress UspA family protein